MYVTLSTARQLALARSVGRQNDINKTNDMSTFEIGNYVFPIIAGEHQKDDYIKVCSFVGTGFFINSRGGFATCKHVVKALDSGLNLFLGQLSGPSAGSYLGITDVQCHPKYDLAWGVVKTKKKTNFLKPFLGTCALGLDVGAFGFTAGGKQYQSLILEPRYLRGHISRMSVSPYEFPSKSLFEVSFPSPSGFSGTALLSESYELVGMLYGNTESKIHAYSITEVFEGSSTFTENAYRVMEFGLAHQVNNIVAILRAEGISIFE